MIRRPPRSTRTDTLFPYTTLFRSARMTRAASWGAIEPDFTAVTGDLRELPPVEPFEVLAARLPMTPTQRDALLQANTLAARRRVAVTSSTPDIDVSIGVRRLEALDEIGRAHV